MGIQNRNTQFINLFGDPDRPIYGNELVTPTQWYYYEVQSCSGPFIGYIRSLTELPINSSVKSPTEGCLEIFSSASTETSLTEWTDTFDSCLECS